MALIKNASTPRRLDASIPLCLALIVTMHHLFVEVVEGTVGQCQQSVVVTVGHSQQSVVVTVGPSQQCTFVLTTAVCVL